MIIEAEPKFVNEFDSKKYVYGVCQKPLVKKYTYINVDIVVPKVLFMTHQYATIRQGIRGSI